MERLKLSGEKMMTTTGGGRELLAIVRQITWCQIVQSLEDQASELNHLMPEFPQH